MSFHLRSSGYRRILEVSVGSGQFFPANGSGSTCWCARSSQCDAHLPLHDSGSRWLSDLESSAKHLQREASLQHHSSWGVASFEPEFRIRRLSVWLFLPSPGTQDRALSVLPDLSSFLCLILSLSLDQSSLVSLSLIVVLLVRSASFVSSTWTSGFVWSWNCSWSFSWLCLFRSTQ